MNECPIFILILHRVTLHAIERYNLNCAKDIRDLQKIIGENDGRSRRDFEQVHRSLGSIENVQKELLRSHEDSRAQEESQARGKSLSDIIFQLLTMCSAKEDLKIIDWLSDFKFRAKQSDVLNSRSGSTGNWILETEEFKDWTTGSGKTLWCTGIRKSVPFGIACDYAEQ